MRTFIALTSLVGLLGCTTLRDEPVIVDPVAQRKIVESCPSCRGGPRCTGFGHPSIQKSKAQLRLERISIPRVDFQDASLQEVVVKLNAISGDTRVAADLDGKGVTIPITMSRRNTSLYEVAAVVAKIESLRLRISEKAVVFVK